MTISAYQCISTLHPTPPPFSAPCTYLAQRPCWPFPKINVQLIAQLLKSFLWLSYLDKEPFTEQRQSKGEMAILCFFFYKNKHASLHYNLVSDVTWSQNLLSTSRSNQSHYQVHNHVMFTQPYTALPVWPTAACVAFAWWDRSVAELWPFPGQSLAVPAVQFSPGSP